MEEQQHPSWPVYNKSWFETQAVISRPYRHGFAPFTIPGTRKSNSLFFPHALWVSLAAVLVSEPDPS